MMSQQFSWQTEDETEWRDQEWGLATGRPTQLGRRRRWLVVTVFVLVGFVVLFAWQAERRVNLATATVSEDIRSSYTLLTRAVAHTDAELFNMLLSSRDVTWMAVQQRLLSEGLLFDHSPMGLEAQTTIPQLVEINLSPDLKEAEITVAGQYSSYEMSPVTLQHSMILRRGRRNWLLSPPDSTYWGTWETDEAQFLTLEYRQRDSAIARRLLADLDGQVAQMCAALDDVRCPEDLELTVRFASDPAALLTRADDLLGQAGRNGLELPTPSLVGRPVDEAGYQMILLSYARPVVKAAIAKAVGWECCEKALFYQALQDYQLDKLGLQPWPLSASEYEAMFANPVVDLGQLDRYWSAPPGSTEGWRQVYAVVAYLMEEGSTHGAATLQRSLMGTDEFRQWLLTLGPDLAAETVQQDWLKHAGSQLATSDDVALPVRDVLLLCDAVSGDRYSLYRYDIGEDIWQTEVADALFLSMSAADDHEGTHLLQRLGQIRWTRGLIWRAENTGQLVVHPVTKGLFRVDTGTASLLVYTHDLLEPAGPTQSSATTACATSGCETSAPAWLPDYSLHDTAMASLTESPLANVDAPDAQSWLQLAPLLAAAAGNIEPDQLLIQVLQTSPADPALTFVAASSAVSDSSYVYLLNGHTDEIRLLTATEYGFGRSPGLDLSPGGRWLSMTSFDRQSSFWQLHIYDALTGAAQTLTSAFPFTVKGYAWSPDDQWLLRLQEGYLHLVAPAEGVHLIIDYDYTDCSLATWSK